MKVCQRPAMTSSAFRSCPCCCWEYCCKPAATGMHLFAFICLSKQTDLGITIRLGTGTTSPAMPALLLWPALHPLLHVLKLCCNAPTITTCSAAAAARCCCCCSMLLLHPWCCFSFLLVGRLQPCVATATALLAAAAIAAAAAAALLVLVPSPRKYSSRLCQCHCVPGSTFHLHNNMSASEGQLPQSLNIPARLADQVMSSHQVWKARFSPTNS